MQKEQQATLQTMTLSSAQLFKYTLLSISFAALILLTIVLPAEYNIDPTGIGEKLGLNVFNQVKETNTATLPTIKKVTGNAVDDAINSTIEKTPVTINVTVPAGRGVEYKFTMQQYQKLTYKWFTNGSELYFDLHGEPEGDTTGYFESYAIATLKNMEGSFTAPFSGVHGWYWKNTSDKPVQVELTVKGEYSKHGLK